MSLTSKLQANTEFIDLTVELVDIISTKMNLDKKTVWDCVSEKSLEELKKSVRKPKKKRAKTAYTMFSKDSSITEDLKKKHGEDITIGEMSKLKSELWKTLSEKDKEKYEQMAKDENEANPVVNDKPKKKKKNKTPYNMFLGDKELRKTITDKTDNKLSMSEVNKEMIKVWNSLTDKKKEKYVKLAEEENKKNNEVTEEEVKEEVNEVKEEVNEVKKEVNEVKEEVKIKKTKKSPTKKKSPAKK
tara:strand:- start:258 stop:989 length:732 start_codon:yes stop_codon:yes gene_type:complete